MSLEDYNTKKVVFIYHNHLHRLQDVQSRLSQVPEDQQKTPLTAVLKIYQEFSNAHALYPFKDSYKRLRKTLKDNPDLYTNEEARPILEDFILAFLKECSFGPLRDIKGLVSEILVVFAAQEGYGQELRRVFQEDCREYLERIIEEEGDEEKVKRDGWALNLDKVDDTIKYLNHFGDLLAVLGSNTETLIPLFLKVHTIILRQLTTGFENNKHIAVKFLQVLAEEMRNCISVTTYYKHELQVLVAEDSADLKIDLMTISLSCRVYLCSINRMNHETACQCSILAVLIDSVILQVKDEEFEHFHLVENEIQSPFSTKTYTQAEDVLKMKQLSIIRSLVICKDNFDIFQKFKTIPESAYSLATQGCVEPNTNLRHYSFKTLSVVLEPIQNREETRRKFLEKGNQHLELFELLLKNWESPIKGITHQIEEVLRTLIKILSNQSPENKERTIEDLRDRIMSLNAGNSKKKYNALAVLMEHIDVETLLAENKGLIYELFSSSGDIHMSSSVTLLEKILAKVYQNLSEDKTLSKDAVFNAWTQYWVDDFVLCIERENFNIIRALMLHITPMLCNLNLASTGFLLNHLMKKDLTRKNYLWCFVSLLKSARTNNLLEYTPDQQGYRFKEAKGEVKIDLTIDVNFIRKMLLNSNRNIMLSILELLTTSPKPAEPLAIFEYSLITEYLKYNLRTSYSDFRNNTITVLKKFFLRLRNIYESNFVKYFPTTKTEFPAGYLDNLGPRDAKPGFKAVTEFLKNSFHTLSQELRPEAEHEAVYPVMEILKLFFQFFGLGEYSYKKNFNFKGTSLLHYIDAFNQNFFTYLLLCLRCSWDMVRFSSQEILQAFPDNHHLLSADYLHNTLLPIAEDLTKNPVIRNAEGGALILSLIDKKFVNKIDFSRLDYSREGRQVPEDLLPSLKFAYYVLGLLERRFKNLQQHFLGDTVEYSNNLIHGLITALGYLVQDLPKSEDLKAPQHKESFRNFFKDLSETVARVLSFATKLSADNISTCILDNSSTVKKINNEIQITNKGETDCRGHFLSETSDSNVMAKLKNVENILYGNTLMETLDENSDFDVENIIVVSFYLITRETGLLFQNISTLLLSLDQSNTNLMNQEDLQLLVDTYFHALLNLKHIGSIDRIAHGLSILCKSMYETKNPILPNLAEELLDKILDAIEQGDFKNVLRRSAGIPPAIICLLKSEPYGKKSRLFPKVMKKLFDFAQNGHIDDIKVHALNVLKFIFQDSNLRADIEAYISQGYIAAVRGFQSTDWAIRNSALMLFSSIAKRTIGTEKVADQSSIKNSINIVEFFTRAPQLVDFFYKEVQDYVENAEQRDSLYPSLYPIALIMSRLLPYDLKNNYLRKAIEAEEQHQHQQQGQEAQEGVVAEAGNIEEVKEHRKFVTMEELRKFLPQFIRAAHNKNYMGRLMCARAVLPFVPYETIVDQVIEILEFENLSHLRILKTDHNFAHGLLLQVYYIIKNHFRLQESYPYETNRFKENLPTLIGYLSERRWIMIYVKCAFIPTVYIQIMKKLLKYIGDEEEIAMREIFAYIYGYSLQTFKEECKESQFRIVPDYGHSILRLKHLEYVLTYDRVASQSLDSYKDILQMFVDKYTANISARRRDDNEPFQVLLKYWNKYLKSIGNLEISDADKAWTIQQFIRLLSQNDFIATEFLHSISEIFSIILNIGCENVITTEQTTVLLRCLETLYLKFAQNSRLMKSVIKAYGILLPTYLSRVGQREGMNFVNFYITLCEKYSHSGQIDSLRVAVIKSFKLSLKPITDRVQDLESFLGLSRVVIRLLQDEIPEIRSKMATFVSKVFKIEEDRFQFKFNPNYILEVYFNYIVQRYQQLGGQQKDQIALNQFILSYIFESEFDKYMELAHYEKRIFAVEKPNKFYSDFVIKRIAYDVYLTMLEKKIVSHYDLKTFLDSQNYKFKEFSERNADKYLTDVINRNEYMFESMLKRIYQDCLIKKTEGVESDFYVKMKENIGLLEPYLRNLIETA